VPIDPDNGVNCGVMGFDKPSRFKIIFVPIFVRPSGQNR
jgi:hypothetical protein